MPTINYQAVFTFLDRVDPVVLDMPEDKVAVEDAVADLKLALGTTACAGRTESAGADDLGPALMDVIVQCENLAAGTREAATHWQSGDREMAVRAETEAVE